MECETEQYKLWDCLAAMPFSVISAVTVMICSRVGFQSGSMIDVGHSA
jgi:hypothetical protein